MTENSSGSEHELSEYIEEGPEEIERTWNDLDNAERKNYLSRTITRSTKGQYKKEAHLSEVISQRRGAGGNLPSFVIDGVLKKQKVYRQLKLNSERNILFLLRQAGERTNYEHAPQLKWILTHEAPTFLRNHESEEAVKQLFVEAKRAWQNAPKSIKGKRHSFPPYKDWLKRCCLMLGLEEDARSLRGLRHPPKIRDMNKIWTYFGETCGWENYEAGIVCEYE